jgi:Flp pilus assembly protein TadD
MQRLLVRIAVLSLCVGTLSACGIFGNSADDSAMAVPGANGQGFVSASTDVKGAVQQARLLRTKGDTEGATRILSQLMMTAPDDPGVVGEYGKLLVQENRFADAVQFLHRAVELQPNDWSLYSATGVAYDQLGDQSSARIAYEHALALKPGEPAILNNYAMSRMLAGDTVAARALMATDQASRSTDPKIARNVALLDSMGPAKPTAQPTDASRTQSGASAPEGGRQHRASRDRSFRAPRAGADHSQRHPGRHAGSSRRCAGRSPPGSRRQARRQIQARTAACGSERRQAGQKGQASRSDSRAAHDRGCDQALDDFSEQRFDHRARLRRTQHGHDLELHQIAPLLGPLLQQLKIVALHDLEAALGSIQLEM